MNVENIAKMRAMEYAYRRSPGWAADLVMSGAVEAQGEVKLKRVQFDTSYELSAKLDEVADLLNVSRREFLEAALVEAIQRAEAAFHETYEEVTGAAFGDEEGA